MRKGSLIKYERNYARYLLLILRKLEYIEEILSSKIKNKAIQF